MNDTEFQKILSATPPLILPAHRRKLFVRTFFRTILFLQPQNMVFQIGILAKLIQLQKPEAYSLLLSADGFTIKDNMNITHKWENVEEFKMAKNGIIYFNVNKGPYASKMSRMIAGHDFSFYNLYAIRTPQLVKLMNHWRKRALQQNG